MNLDILRGLDWGVLMAALAIILSQLPPIKQMIRGKKLRMASPERAKIYHWFGNTHMTLWLDLENIGGRDIRIKEITCLVARRGDYVQTLSARTYWLTESLTQDEGLELPLSEIPLRPGGGRWSGFLHFIDTKTWTMEIETRAKNITTYMEDDINEKLRAQALTVPPAERIPVEADAQIMSEVTSIVNTVRKLQVGDYQLFVAAYEDTNAPPLGLLTFDLTLFEKDMRGIFDDLRDYKYGFGVFRSPRKPANVMVEIRRNNTKVLRQRFALLTKAQ